MKTVERMADNRATKSTVVYPAEIGRGAWSLDNPPSAVGLKLLLVAVSALGDAVADDVLHDVPVTVLRSVPAVAGMGKDDLLGVLRSLVMASASLDLRDPSGSGSVSVGSLVSYAEIDYSGSGVLSCRLRFGDVFRKMLAASELFAVIDRALALSLRSRYSVLLYQFIATHWRKDHVRQVKLPLSDLRAIFALSGDTHAEFKAFRRHVLDKAVSEISERSDYALTAKPYYEGSRAVAGVVISWERKATAKPVGAGASKGAAKSRKAAVAKPVEKASDADLLAFYADMVRRNAAGVSAAVSSSMAKRLLAAGLVSAADLRAANLPVADGGKP